MATAKIVLRKKQNIDGTFPLTLRVTEGRKSTYIFLGKSLQEKFWDNKKGHVKSSYPNSKRLNNFLIKQLNLANEKILELELQQKTITLQMIREALAPKKENNTFFAQVELYFEPLITEGKYNRVSADRPAFNHFRGFLKGRDILFQDITIQLLEQFRAFLRGDIKVSERTAFNHLALIRTIYKRAIANGVADAGHYPFGVNKIRLRKPESLKIGLGAEDVGRIESLELDVDNYEHHARNVWLFSFYFAGMRASDVLLLRWSDFDDTRLHYIMEKNNKPGSLKIPDKAKAILGQYRHLKKDKNDLVFPDLKGFYLNDKATAQKRIKYIVKKLNGRLKTIAKKAHIDKPLTMHIARHTFGNISGDRIPVQMLQKLYRHSNIETTVNYQKAFNRGVDEALDAVLNF